MKSLRRQQDQKQKPKTRLLKAGAAAMAITAAAYFLAPERANPAPTETSSPVVSSRPPSSSSPQKKITKSQKSRMEKRQVRAKALLEFLKAMQQTPLYRIQSDFAYDSMDCPYLEKPGRFGEPKLPTFDSYFKFGETTDPTMAEIISLYDAHDLEMLAEVITYLDSLNIQGLNHHYYEAYKQQNMMVPDIVCLEHVNKATLALQLAQELLMDLILEGTADFADVFDNLPERWQDIFLSEFAMKMLFDHMAVEIDHAAIGNHNLGLFEQHFLSMPDDLRKRLGGELIGLAHHLDFSEAMNLFLNKSNSNYLSYETQELINQMLVAYELKVLAEIDEGNARIIYGDYVHTGRE